MSDRPPIIHIPIMHQIITKLGDPLKDTAEPYIDKAITERKPDVMAMVMPKMKLSLSMSISELPA